MTENIEDEFQIVAEIQSATDSQRLKEIALGLYYVNCHLRQCFKDMIKKHPSDFTEGAYEKIAGESDA